MRLADVQVLHVFICKVQRKGQWYVVERYNGYYNTKTVSGPLSHAGVIAAVAERNRYWDGIRKALTADAMAAITGIAG